MPDEIDRKLIDKRVVSRYLRKGRLDEKELERQLRALPDLAEQAVPVVSRLDDDLDDEEEEELPEEPPAAAPVATAAPQGEPPAS